jgi:predicted DNA-binding helix-hairpin-helix protein
VGNLDLTMDPKLAWALAHREQFPVDVNTAPREMLLRIPGIGVKSVNAILRARRHRRLRMDDLARLRLPLAKISPFVITQGHLPGTSLDSVRLRQRLTPKAAQTDLFA